MMQPASRILAMALALLAELREMMASSTTNTCLSAPSISIALCNTQICASIPVNMTCERSRVS